MDDIKKPEEQVSAAPAELTQAELAKVAGGDVRTAGVDQVGILTDRRQETTTPPAPAGG
jgi:hypothetical protein